MEELPSGLPPMEDPRPSETNSTDVVTYDNHSFQFIVDGGEVVESCRRSEVQPAAQEVVEGEPLSLEVTNEVDIENVGMEYDIVSSEGHAAKPRCTPEEKESILQFALDHSVREASNKYGISQVQHTHTHTHTYIYFFSGMSETCKQLTHTYTHTHTLIPENLTMYTLAHIQIASPSITSLSDTSPPGS